MTDINRWPNNLPMSAGPGVAPPGPAVAAAPRVPKRRSAEVEPERKKIKLDPLRIALVALTLIGIGKAHLIAPGVSRLRPALLLALFGLAYAVINPSRLAVHNLFRYWPPKAVGALVMMACFSIAFGISTGNAGKYMVEEYSKVLIYGFLLMVTIRSAGDLRLYFMAYVSAAAVLVWHSHVLGISKTQGVWGFDANDAALILLLAIPFLLFMFQTTRTRGKIAAILILLGVISIVAKSESRGAFVGLVVVGLMLLLTLTSVNIVKRMAVLVGVSGVLVVGAPDGYWDLVRSLKSPKDDYNWDASTGRRQLAIRGVQYMLDYPMFGIGVANFPRAEGMLSERAQSGPAGKGVRWAAAHNSHIQIAAEMGIPGILIWFGMQGAAIIGVFRLRRKIPKRWARGDPDQKTLYFACQHLPIALVGFLVTSTFLSFAYFEPIYFLMAMTTGVYVVAGQLLRTDRTPARVLTSTPPRPVRAAAPRPPQAPPLRTPPSRLDSWHAPSINHLNRTPPPPGRGPGV